MSDQLIEVALEAVFAALTSPHTCRPTDVGASGAVYAAEGIDKCPRCSLTGQVRVAVTVVREQIASDLEQVASDRSYDSPYEITEAYLNAAKIARGES